MIARRIFRALLTLVAVSVATFGFFFALPADPAVSQCGRQCGPAQVDQVRHALRLDRPVPEQYAEFMAGIVTGRDIGDTHCPAPCLGFSFRTHEPVTAMIGRALPVTVSVVAGAAVLWLLVGVGLGTFAALRRGTWLDRLTIGLAVAGSSAQTFFVGLVLQVVLVYGLGWLPAPAYVSPLDSPWRWFTGMLLPWMTLATVLAGGYARLTRTMVASALTEDFVRTARAAGLSQRRVARQAVRVGIMPVVTMAGLDVGGLLGGAVITETVFGLPGLGTLAVRATQELNLPVVLATVLLSAVFVVVTNLVVDLLHPMVDPRVR